jgi:hypothetical protein
MSDDSKASPEIKVLIDKLTTAKSTDSYQSKYEAILARKSYDHQCFLECVLLRLDRTRSVDIQCGVQNEADRTFTHMLEHGL